MAGAKSSAQIGGRVDGETFTLTQATASHNAGEYLTVATLDRDCPLRFRILDVRIKLAAAGVAGGQLRLEIGDGEADEAFVAVTNAMSTDGLGAYSIIRPTTIDTLNDVVAKGGSLAVYAVSGSTHQYRIEVDCRREDA